MIDGAKRESVHKDRACQGVKDKYVPTFLYPPTERPTSIQPLISSTKNIIKTFVCYQMFQSIRVM